MTRTERLYRIDQLLRSRRSLTRQELLEALECSQATLTRDIEYLRSQLNAPIVFDNDLGAYRLDAVTPGPAYALPGLSNLWMILIKATPLLFLLGVKDIVYYARELGGTKTQAYDFPHADWRLYYFLGLLVFYLLMTRGSEILLGRVAAKLSKGQATAAGEAMRKAAI